MRTSHARRAAAVLVTTALVGALAGCASEAPAGGSPGTSGGAAGESSKGTAEGTTEDPDLVGGLPQGGVACVDWVRFLTPAEAASDAGAVLLGKVVQHEGTARLYGVEANRWLFDVEEVLERPDPEDARANPAAEPPPELEVSAGQQVSIVSTPETCGGADAAYPGGDPLDPAAATGGGAGSGPVIVLLSGSTDDGSGDEPVGFHLITPYQGVVQPTDDGGLPAEWPDSP
ncbi:hypothetical protein [Promicromonospora sukumoe]|uniref:hypothetical protein n=1 Tax=Promicromonospora sukumoe TaxID=88382 RepID=UPI003660E2DB